MSIARSIVIVGAVVLVFAVLAVEDGQIAVMGAGALVAYLGFRGTVNRRFWGWRGPGKFIDFRSYDEQVDQERWDRDLAP
jgi:hypothetical protein